ncbi:unnamed protein product [Soboliphyme baturini]|uniref:Transposase n=1 Tax=Soboliphyme baturini TaxID=241478 RepID=A0A183IF29_9BILA|nr:unnamed protein product [Soboliphyme baturini]
MEYIRRSGGSSNRRIKWETLYSVDKRAKLANNIARRFEQILVMTTDVETEWKVSKSRDQKRTSSWTLEVQLIVTEKKASFKGQTGTIRRKAFRRRSIIISVQCV